MTRRVFVEGSASSGKTLRQKLKAMQLFAEGKKVGIISPDKKWLSLDPEKMNYDDVVDMLALSWENVSLHKCPNCGHRYPNYSFYGYHKKFYICPKCNHKEEVKK